MPALLTSTSIACGRERVDQPPELRVVVERGAETGDHGRAALAHAGGGVRQRFGGARDQHEIVVGASASQIAAPRPRLAPVTSASGRDAASTTRAA